MRVIRQAMTMTVSTATKMRSDLICFVSVSMTIVGFRRPIVLIIGQNNDDCNKFKKFAAHLGREPGGRSLPCRAAAGSRVFWC